ncbi:MAG: pyruvate, water dikinase regulatory protein [Spirochaetota bacterium]
MSGKRPIVWVVSDGTGRTALQMIRAASYQFEGVDLDVRVVPEVTTSERITGFLDRAADEPGLVVFTVVSEEHRRLLKELAGRRGLVTVDLFDSLINGMQAFLKAPPLEVPGLSHRKNADYFRMIDAVDFTVKHDDGRMLETAGEADIVLVGPSRVGKTPLALYLANQGWKVANVPLVPGRPPEGLEGLERVVCILIEHNLLQRRRRERLRRLGNPLISGYTDVDSIKEELRYCSELAGARGWPVLDGSYRPIEDIAHQVLKRLGLD